MHQLLLLLSAPIATPFAAVVVRDNWLRGEPGDDLLMQRVWAPTVSLMGVALLWLGAIDRGPLPNESPAMAIVLVLVQIFITGLFMRR